jgi:Animal haem peroxidase
VFETARRLTRWHYQWAVIHDFLPRFVGDGLVGPNGTVYREVAGKPPVIALSYYKPTNKDGRPFMPVEFAVAAYRFGHTIIRPFYVINQSTLDRGGVPVFGSDGASTSTAAARSLPTWSWSGRTSFPSTRTSRLASRARSTRSCRCR